MLGKRKQKKAFLTALSNCSIFSRRCFNEHEGHIVISVKDPNQHLFEANTFGHSYNFLKNVKGSLKGEVKLQYFN